jgi:hypothetical protein
VFVFVVEEGRRKKESEINKVVGAHIKQTVEATSRPRRGEARQAEGLQAHVHARGLRDHEDNEAGSVE